MRRFRPTAIPGSEITPEASYLQRRDILRLGAAGGLALAV
jgi:sulfoxide reductase catalytic subunit YedY